MSLYFHIDETEEGLNMLNYSDWAVKEYTFITVTYKI